MPYIIWPQLQPLNEAQLFDIISFLFIVVNLLGYCGINDDR